MHEDYNPKDSLGESRQNQEEAKKMQETISSSQARNMPKNFIANSAVNESTDEITNETEGSEAEQRQEVEQKAKANANNPLKKFSTLMSGKGDVDLNPEAAERIFGAFKRKLITYGIIFAVVILTIVMFVSTILSFSENNRAATLAIKVRSAIANFFDTTNYKSVKVNDKKFDKEEDKPEEFFDENVKDDIIKYLVRDGYCSDDNCEKSDAYAFFKKLAITVLEHEKNGESIDVGLLYETMAYYRADDELFLGSSSSTSTNQKWWQVVLNLFRTKTDEMDTLVQNMFKNKRIDLNQYAAYLLYGNSIYNTSGSTGSGSAHVVIRDAQNMADAMVKLALEQEGTGEPNKFQQWYGQGAYGGNWPWCAIFVSWVFAHAEYNGQKLGDSVPFKDAGVANLINKFMKNGNGIKFYHNDYCSGFAGMNGGGTYTPKRGDIIFIYWNNNGSQGVNTHNGWNGKGNAPHNDGSQHTGIVTEVSGNRVSTVEGNRSNVVKQESYSLSDCRIVGYGSWY